MNINLSDKFRWILKDSGGYIYSNEDKSVKVINDSGVYILKNIKNNDITSLAAKMAERYENVTQDELVKDITAFLESLKAGGYVCFQ